MLQKALKVASTLALLLAGYVGYVRGFSALMTAVGRPRPMVHIPARAGETPSEKVASDLARRAFGPGHWSSDPDRSFRYYDASRNYWLYARDQEFIDGNKRMKLKPFSVIWRSSKDDAVKTLSATEALIEFDRPIDPAKGGGGAAHVVNAKMMGEVYVRNDKGSVDLPDDDLVIGPLTGLEFDEKSMQLRSDSDVPIRDKGLHVTGVGLLIDLLPKGTGRGGGFDPDKVTLFKDIRIVMDDVGSSGMVPAASPAPTKTKDGRPIPREKKPGELVCRGPMVVHLPKPRRPVKVGPPAPKGPTIAEFSRNVVVRQGTGPLPDQLDADYLHLTLVPADRPVKPAGSKTNPADVPESEGPAPSDESLGSLQLAAARATGHAVWLQSPSQGKKGLGNELIFTRRLPEAPDTTYFRGDKVTTLESINYEDDGTIPAVAADRRKVESIDFIESVDFTLFQFGAGLPPTIVSRGPGHLETRADRDKPVDREVVWEDQLKVQNVGQGANTRRVISLVGPSKVTTPNQGNNSIEAKRKLVAYMKPESRSLAEAEVEVDGKPLPRKKAKRGDGSGKIDWVEAEGDVVLETTGAGSPATADRPAKGPGRQRLLARERLDVVFVPGKPAAPRPDEAAAPKADPAPPPGDPNANPMPQVAGADAPAEKAAEPPPPEPPLLAEADTAWARVEMSPEDESAPVNKAAGEAKSPKGTVQKAFLRGRVSLHQDPSANKVRGTDVKADQVDMDDRGEGLAEIHALGTVEKPAVAMTDGFTIIGPFLGVDQSTDYAWVKGPGKLIQEKLDGPIASPGAGEKTPRVERVTFKDEKAAKPRNAKGAKAKDEKPRGPVTITWTREMKFYGKTIDPRGGLGNAKAEFYDNVHAKSDDSIIDCAEMHAMLDGPVSFRKPRDGQPAAPDDADPEKKKANPKLVWVKCFSEDRRVNFEVGPDGRTIRRPEAGPAPANGRKVEVVRREVDPATKLLKSKDRLIGDDVFYDMLTGDFDVDGKGLIRHYARKSEEGAGPLNRVPNPGTAAGQPRVRPVSDNPKARADVAKAKTKAAPKGAKKPDEPPLELTRITFHRAMKGKIGTSPAGDASTSEEAKPKGPSQATFWGDVKMLHAVVADENADLDADAFKRPPDLMQFDCKTLHVDTLPAPEPPDGDPAKKQPDQIWLTAWRNVHGIDKDRGFKGDRLTYDSTKELYWIYGDKGNQATITQQPIPGAAPSNTGGDAIMVNRKTGQTHLIGARDGAILDTRSGTPLAPSMPNYLPDTLTSRTEPKLPGRADKERQGFRGH